ncbi:MAG: diguanylate cyclase [Candidatus Hydrogenedentes bacterium]|nr:diguanylate cyclase [Candidatus Hydrogenedentota bacterium]
MGLNNEGLSLERAWGDRRAKSGDPRRSDTERMREARILVADDQEGVVTLIERVIANAFQCRVRTASSGTEALALLARERYDVFLTDMKMPGVHGFELIEKALESDPDLNVLVMTGYADDFPYVEVIHKGARDFLNKPFLPAELEAKLIRVLREMYLRHDLLVAHRKYRSLFDLSMDGTLLIRMEGGRIEDANDAICSVLSLSAEDLLGGNFGELVAGHDRERFEQWMLLCARSGKGTIGDLQVQHPSGKKLHFDVTVTMVTADSEQFAFLAFRDITEKRETDRELEEAAQKDALTGLYNKRTFTNRLEWAVTSATEKNSPLALLTIDLDNFKRCNDTHGHQAGDMLLKNVGEVIKRSIRIKAYDEGFRCGGDEFSVLLHNFSPGGPAAVAARMHLAFSELECYGTTMSIGIAEFRPGMAASDFVEAADKALYSAKAQGKNATCHAP